MTDAQAMLLDSLGEEFHATAVAKGWYDQSRSPLELLCLVHGEVSEAAEAVRDHNPGSVKCPGITAVEEELADILVRVLDMAAAKGYRLGLAVKLKAAYNLTRPHRHGGKAY